MKYILSIIAIIVIALIYESSQKEKKTERLKKVVTCQEFLKTNSKECLESPWLYVGLKSEEKAIKEIENFKAEINKLNIELDNFFNNKKINESEYQIISWSDFDSVDYLIKEINKEKLAIYDKKIVAISKLSGCLTVETLKSEIEYFLCSDNINKDDEFRTTIYINNIEELTNLKKVLDKLSILGLRSEGLFRSNINLYDLQVYGKIKKIEIMHYEMEVHNIKFFKKLVSDKQILNMLEKKIFWSDWNKVREFQNSRSF
tara:strand:- start:152 stop:928 length:777 start_codon:yes stop_codon:yes gene_type:complete